MASTGTIIVNVYSSNAKIPVEGAVVLYRQQASPYSLLGLRVTDSSGKTQALTLDTVDAAASQTPEQQAIPWTGLILQIDHPDYERVMLQGVQIFPDVITVQNVQLLPLLEHDPELDGQQDLIITPQPVWEAPT